MHSLNPSPLFILVLAMSAAPSSWAAQDKAPAIEPITERALYEACSGDSQAGMRDCLARHAADSEVTLRAAEVDAAAAIGRWDEDKKYATAARTRLAAASKAFITYRAAQCAYSTALSGGAAGNAAEMGRLACTAALNLQRAQQLRDLSVGLPSR